MSGMRSFGLAACVALCMALPAHAQSTRYDVKTMNFDLWCQEQQRLPPDRCDKRLPEDEKAFETYRAKIEKYEIPFLQRKDKEQELDRNVLHQDPLDSPVYKNNNNQATTPTPQQDPQ